MSLARAANSDVVKRLAVNIRKFLLRAHRFSDLVSLGTLTPQAASFLEASVPAGLNILVAGGTQAGAKGHVRYLLPRPRE